MQDFSRYAAGLESEVTELREKSEADEKRIGLLTQQNELLAMENSQMAADHAEAMRVLRRRCDDAVRKEQDITLILDAAAKSIMQGLRKKAGDQTPAQIPDRAPARRPPQPNGDSVALLPEIIPPSREPASVRPINHNREVPAEVAHFAPPRYARPAVDDEIDDGLRDIVQRVGLQQR